MGNLLLLLQVKASVILLHGITVFVNWSRVRGFVGGTETYVLRVRMKLWMFVPPLHF